MNEIMILKEQFKSDIDRFSVLQKEQEIEYKKEIDRYKETIEQLQEDQKVSNKKEGVKTN